MARGERLRDFAAEHDLPVVAIADLVRHRTTTEQLVQRVATATMPTEYGEFRALVYQSTVDCSEHLALEHGDPAAASRGGGGALVRVHSECLTGDVFAALR